MLYEVITGVEAALPGMPCQRGILRQSRPAMVRFPAEGRGTAPGFTSGAFAAGQVKRAQRSEAQPGTGAAAQGFAAPERAVSYNFV